MPPPAQAFGTRPPVQPPRPLHAVLAAAALVWCSVCAAEMAVPIDGAPGVVHLPDNWRPIPRAEILEARERAEQVSGQPAGPLPAAAFQRLPTLQWFALPHALVFWQPKPDGTAATGALADDVRLREHAGRSARGPVHVWHAEVLRQDGQFTIDLITLDDDGRSVILGLAEGLRERP